MHGLAWPFRSLKVSNIIGAQCPWLSMARMNSRDKGCVHHMVQREVLNMHACSNSLNTNNKQ